MSSFLFLRSLDADRRGYRVRVLHFLDERCQSLRCYGVPLNGLHALPGDPHHFFTVFFLLPSRFIQFSLSLLSSLPNPGLYSHKSGCPLLLGEAKRKEDVVASGREVTVGRGMVAGRWRGHGGAEAGARRRWQGDDIEAAAWRHPLLGGSLDIVAASM